ncbi:hypothetical protein A5724_11535 [Mycobacterium sp. ACS1612]|nr:hypothetical protein A5724_11535 [Mycobacterium sp. ACS1612]
MPFSNTASPVRWRRLLPEAADEAGCTAVYRSHLGSNVAACSCGWSARRRIWKSIACLDAWTHSAHVGCDLNVPLVIPERH